jgi:hypothetical protein
MTPKAEDGLATNPSLNGHPYRGVHRRVGAVPRGATDAGAQAHLGPTGSDDDHDHDHPPAAGDHDDDAPGVVDHRRSDDHLASDYLAAADLFDVDTRRDHHDDTNLHTAVHLKAPQSGEQSRWRASDPSIGTWIAQHRESGWWSAAMACV